MINRLYLKNFTCFNEIEINFEKQNNEPVKLAYIYGENGAGKSNIVRAISFLNELFFAFRNKDYNLKNRLIRFKKVNSINEEMIIKLYFIKDNKKASYEVRFDDKKIIYEELKYDKNKNFSTVYKINNLTNDIWIDEKFIFKNSKYKDEILYELSKYRGNFTFLSIINYSLININDKFITNSIAYEFKVLFDEFNNFAVFNNNSEEYKNDNSFMKLLLEGKINPNQSNRISFLKREENILTYFYSSLYSRVNKVFYKYTEENGEIFYKLFVEEKDEDGKTFTIPFDFVSNGSRRLLNIYGAIRLMLDGKTVVFDEIDTCIHDLMIKDVIKGVEELLDEDFNGQLIATTHNTLLMRHLNPKQIFILNEDYHGNKSIYSVSTFRDQIQRTNNIQKRYLEGMYGGIPYTSFSPDTFKYVIEENLDE